MSQNKEQLFNFLKDIIIKDSRFKAIDWGYLLVDEEKILEEAIKNTIEISDIYDENTILVALMASSVILNIKVFILEEQNKKLLETYARLSSRKS